MYTEIGHNISQQNKIWQCLSDKNSFTCITLLYPVWYGVGPLISGAVSHTVIRIEMPLSLKNRLLIVDWASISDLSRTKAWSCRIVNDLQTVSYSDSWSVLTSRTVWRAISSSLCVIRFDFPNSMLTLVRKQFMTIKSLSRWVHTFCQLIKQTQSAFGVQFPPKSRICSTRLTRLSFSESNQIRNRKKASLKT